MTTPTKTTTQPKKNRGNSNGVPDTERRVLIAIKRHIDKNPADISAIRDLHRFLWTLRGDGREFNSKPYWHDADYLKVACTRALRQPGLTNDDANELGFILKNAYLFDARDRFEDFMYYAEWERRPNERFYAPRAKVLKNVADAIQQLLDDELDELFLSQPARTGKTTIIMFATIFIMLRDSEKANLYSAYSDTITKAFYSGILELLQDPTTYAIREVFPEFEIVSTDSKEETIDINRKKRYKSLTARSLYGTLNGACDCNGFMIADDLIGGIEEALSKERMMGCWSKVENNLMARCKQQCKRLWIATRWSQIDPIGLRTNLLISDKRMESVRYKIVNLPALNDDGESNFDYDYGLGFSTEFYIQRRASFEKNDDMASWYAQYCGDPVERAGTLFEPSDMLYYNGEMPDDDEVMRKFMAVDPAFGGGDFCAGIIIYQTSSGELYAPGVSFSNASKNYTQPLLAQKIINFGVGAVQFECTRMTVAYKEAVEELLNANNYRCNVNYKTAGNRVAKEVRIFNAAPDIRKIHFLEPSKRDKEYDQFMANLFSFKIEGGNKHDDAPDVCAQVVTMLQGTLHNCFVMKRRF